MLAYRIRLRFFIEARRNNPFDKLPARHDLCGAMFGIFSRAGKAESRAAEVDVGSLYAQFFAFGASSYSWQQSPAVIASSLSVPDGAGALLTEARRLSRISPILNAYIRCMVGGITTGAPERPEFAEGVPERVAAAAADLWERRHDCERERDLLHRVMVDGEIIILPDGQIVPPDGFEPIMAGPDWMREVRGYRIGRGAGVRADVFYLGDRRMGDARAVPWIGPAMPFAQALANIRISAGHGLGALSRIAAVVANASPDRITAGAGHRTGVVGTRDTDNAAGAVPITSTGIGSVPYLKPGEEIARAMAGPDKVAQEYESLLERDCAGALNLPLSELRSDYSTGSFSNLRMSLARRRKRIPAAADLVASALPPAPVARAAVGRLRRWAPAPYAGGRHGRAQAPDMEGAAPRPAATRERGAVPCPTGGRGNHRPGRRSGTIGDIGYEKRASSWRCGRVKSAARSTSSIRARTRLSGGASCWRISIRWRPNTGAR